MKSYDDLQRFKEKTHTNHIEFKDMSEQTKNSDSANWAIIKQLMNDSTTPTLGNGQSINVAVPQPIAEDTFSLAATPLQARPDLPARRTPSAAASRAGSVAAFVAAQPADVGSRSLLESVSASLKPALTTLSPAAADAHYPTGSAPADIAQAHAGFAESDVRPAAEEASTDIFTQLQKFAPLPVAQPARPVARSAVETETPRFKQLFSATSEARTLSKDTLLQPLLERIALCR